MSELEKLKDRVVAEKGSPTPAHDFGPSLSVSYIGAVEPPNGGWIGQLPGEAAQQLAFYLNETWPLEGEGSVGLHVHAGKIAPFPPIEGYDTTLDTYDVEQQRHNTIRIENRRLASFGRYATGFNTLKELASTCIAQVTQEDDLEVYDSHILRQKEKTCQLPAGSDGGSRFGRHRDNHDNPGKSVLRYSLSIILTGIRGGHAPSSMRVWEPSGLPSLEYPTVAGGYVLFRSQHLHASEPGKPHQGTLLKLVFFFKKRKDAHPTGGYCDHLNRPYFDPAVFMDASSYVHHRLGAVKESMELAGVVTLADVWRTAHALMPLVVAEVEETHGRRGMTRGIVWSSGMCSSVCFGRGVVDRIVASEADRCAPRSIFPPSSFSTQESMREQITRCTELDDMSWNMTGRVERVNATTYPQPRRKSWSVVLDELDTHEDGRKRYELFSYSQSYRTVDDWRGSPMPVAVFQLGVRCWTAAWAQLSPISQACPPTGCQLMAYLTVFNSSVGRHRDNGVQAPEGKHGRLGNSEDENSQIRGSSVLVYTRGPPMTLALSAPPRGKMPWQARKDEYEIEPSLTVSLDEGTLYVLDPRDDENYCHEAWFEQRIIMRGADVRRAYVFRWLSKRRLFYADVAGCDRNRCTGE